MTMQPDMLTHTFKEGKYSVINHTTFRVIFELNEIELNSNIF